MKPGMNYMRARGHKVTERILKICINYDNWANFYRASHLPSVDYAMARCLSVCLSVPHMPVFCLSG